MKSRNDEVYTYRTYRDINLSLSGLDAKVTMVSLVSYVGKIEDALAELDMDNYDSDGENSGGGRPFGAGPPGMSFYRYFSNRISG